jgi:hypothetical protein
MGAEAQTTVRMGRKTAAGKALLETNEIIFRGDVRLKIPLKDITALEAKSGRLTITWPEGKASFELGDQAAKWADKIRNPKSRLDKLGIKPCQHVSIINVKEKGFLAELRARAASVSNGTAAKDSDAIFLGAETPEELDAVPELVPYIKRDGAIWTVTPKGKGGVREADVMAVGKAAGLVDVKVVAFSETHSANKFVIPKNKR